MALIHQAELRPSKQELIAQWLPSQPWFLGGDTAALARIGSYRFDDPDGEVGMETFLMNLGETVYHLPLTYRGEPLDCAEEWLVGTMHHSVLGQRWVYDGCGDPTYVSALVGTMMAGDPQAEEVTEVDGGTEVRASSVRLASVGPVLPRAPRMGQRNPVTEDDKTVIRSGDLVLSIARIPELGGHVGGNWALTGIWEGQPRPVQLASLTREGH
jgi:hypothetical protein